MSGMFPTADVIYALTQATSKVTEAKEMLAKVKGHKALRKMNSQMHPNFPSADQVRRDIRRVLDGASNVEGMLQHITDTLGDLKQWEDGWEKKEARKNFAMAKIVYGVVPKPEWVIELEERNKKKQEAAEAKKAKRAADKTNVQTKKKSKPKKTKTGLVECKKVEKSDEGENKEPEQGEQKA